MPPGCPSGGCRALPHDDPLIAASRRGARLATGTKALILQGIGPADVVCRRLLFLFGLVTAVFIIRARYGYA